MEVRRIFIWENVIEGAELWVLVLFEAGGLGDSAGFQDPEPTEGKSSPQFIYHLSFSVGSLAG